MIYCEICTNTFSGEDFVDCPHCALAEGRAATSAVSALDAPAAGTTMGEVIDNLRRLTPPETPAEPPAIPTTAPQPPEGMSEGLRALVEQKVDQAAAAAAEPTTFASTGTEPAAIAPIIGQGGRELDVETLRRIRESGVFTVVLLGFPTAGKTWFLNRLKYELQEGDAYACYPRRAPPGDVENTTLFTAHRFRKGENDFYVIDIPGERFLRAVEGSFLGEANTLMRHVIHTGQAFLTLLPADETLLSELAHDVLWRRSAAGETAPVDLASLPPAQALIDRVDLLKRQISQARKSADGGDGKAQTKLKTLVRERKRLLEGGVEQALHRLASKHEELGEYISGVGLMAQLMVVMDERGGPDLDPSIDAYAVFDRSRDAERKKPTKPMFIVLSKSDDLTHRSDAVQLPIRRLLQGHPQAAHLLRILRREPRKADAFAMLNTLRPGVARQIDEWFALASFQFATAFEGVARGSTTINYRLSHVGVTELIRALLRLKEHTEKRRAWDGVASLFRRRPPAETPVAESAP
ncbi:GTPase [Caulobacter segnis]|jgi:hypothetical protein|uniref:GTPase n=1 Tax=Caulobacter segnis TaxID=88688 RepID=UPI001CBD3F0C|nr:GTPase [Caulobacter segnis]UAL12558.1 50S ribosome-binding GTPase [Caulobacter segnis]